MIYRFKARGKAVSKSNHFMSHPRFNLKSEHRLSEFRLPIGMRCSGVNSCNYAIDIPLVRKKAVRCAAYTIESVQTQRNVWLRDGVKGSRLKSEFNNHRRPRKEIRDKSRVRCVRSNVGSQY